MDQLITKIIETKKIQNFDTIGVAVLDFNSGDIQSFEHTSDPYLMGRKIWYDLASLTKALTMGAGYLAHPEEFGERDLLLLEHRSGIPSWGRLSRNTWKDQVLGYDITPSSTVYSDFGAIRLGLRHDLYSMVEPLFDKELVHWLGNNDLTFSASTGIRWGKEIRGTVHDDNAYVISEKVVHAGLFSTLEGLCQTLLNLEDKLGMIEKMSRYIKGREERFVRGFDTVVDPTTTLAGLDVSDQTFGHLGFTGTSFWIDPVTRKGRVLLTNETKKYWYNRTVLNSIRRFQNS